MPRNCGWCDSSQRAEWEQRLAKGEPVSVVVADTPFSESAARRHLRSHLQPALLAEMHLSGLEKEVHLSDFADRLMGLAEQAVAVRVYAEQTRNPKLMLQAIQSERETIGVLMNRLGVDSGSSVEFFNEARTLGGVLGTVLHGPGGASLIEPLASALEAEGLDKLAGTIRRQSESTNRALPEREE